MHEQYGAICISITEFQICDKNCERQTYGALSLRRSQKLTCLFMYSLNIEMAKMSALSGLSTEFEGVWLRKNVSK